MDFVRRTPATKRLLLALAAGGLTAGAYKAGKSKRKKD